MVSKALETIYEYNVLKFANGQMGAVNGMKPDGTIDREYIQVGYFFNFHHCYFWSKE